MPTFDVQLFPRGGRTTVEAGDVLRAAEAARGQLGGANVAVVELSPDDQTHAPHGRLRGTLVWLDDSPHRAAVHFAGFRDPQRWANAARLWGEPDVVHRTWDLRAAAEVADGDLVVLASGDPERPSRWVYDDSNQPGDPAARERG